MRFGGAAMATSARPVYDCDMSPRPIPSADRRYAPPVVPAWAVPRGMILDVEEAAFLAGAALNSLDGLVRAQPDWGGAWRQRLALKAAVSAARVAGRSEDEAALRDVWLLRSAGDDPGPAGSILSAWRRLALRGTMVDGGALQETAGLFGIRWSDDLAVLPERLDEIARSATGGPFAAAEIAGAVHDLRPDAELLGWWLADLALARALRWPVAVPLLMAQRHASAFRTEGGRGRIRPGEEQFRRAVCLALAQAATEACRLAGDMARRADRLAAVTPKLRAKGAGEAIRLLLEEDAVSGSLQTAKLSRWASRRLFDRLVEFDAVRELSGRSTFRLYGL